MADDTPLNGRRSLVSRERKALPRTWTAKSLGSLGAFVNATDGEAGSTPDLNAKRMQMLVTVACVATWMGCNLAVLLLNKLLLTFWAFKQPVLLTFLHMISATAFTWGLWGAKLLTIQRIQSTSQLLKLTGMSLVFVLAVLCANISLKYLAVSMNQAIGAATPVFAAVFAFLCQRQIEHGFTYATLLLVVGGVIVASGVEPNLHVVGAFVCFVGAAFRGLRAVLQAILLRPEEKLDSMSCLAYMVPVSSALMLFLCPIVEPAGIPILLNLPWAGAPMVLAVTANCVAAFGSNYFNMAVTKRTSALTIQVLGQCKGIISAIVSVLCFRNVVPVFGWLGYGITVIGCILYGRCKVHFGKARAAQLGINTDTAEKRWLHQVQNKSDAPLMAGTTMGMNATMDLGSETSNSLLRPLSPRAIDIEAQQERLARGSHAASRLPPRDPHSNGRHIMQPQAEGLRSGSSSDQRLDASAALMHGPRTNHERLAHAALTGFESRSAASQLPAFGRHSSGALRPGLRGLLAATLPRSTNASALLPSAFVDESDD